MLTIRRFSDRESRCAAPLLRTRHMQRHLLIVLSSYAADLVTAVGELGPIKAGSHYEEGACLNFKHAYTRMPKLMTI